jgi:stage V sporulation protein G
MSKVTDVRIFKVEDGGKLKARANATINGDFAVNGLRIFEGDNGPFVSMPTGPKYQKDGKDVYPEVCFPTTKEFGEEFRKAIIDAYKNTLT